MIELNEQKLQINLGGFYHDALLEENVLSQELVIDEVTYEHPPRPAEEF